MPLQGIIRQKYPGADRVNAPSFFNNFLNAKVLSKEPKFNGVYSRNNLPKTKDGTYV